MSLVLQLFRGCHHCATAQLITSNHAGSWSPDECPSAYLLTVGTTWQNFLGLLPGLNNKDMLHAGVQDCLEGQLAAA